MVISQECVACLYPRSVSRGYVPGVCLVVISPECVSWLYPRSVAWLYPRSVSRAYIPGVCRVVISPECVSWLCILLTAYRFVILTHYTGNYHSVVATVKDRKTSPHFMIKPEESVHINITFEILSKHVVIFLLINLITYCAYIVIFLNMNRHA